MDLDEQIKKLCEEGNKHERAKKYDLAIEKFKKALEIAEKLETIEKNDIRYDKGWFYIAIGEQYFLKKDLEASLKYYQMANKHPFHICDWFVICRIADILRESEKYLEAREKYILALKYIKELETEKDQINSYMSHSSQVLRELENNEIKLGFTIKEKINEYLTQNNIKFKKIGYLKTYETDKKIYYISIFKNGLFDKGKMIIFDGENFVFNEKYNVKTEKQDVISLLKLDKNINFRVIDLPSISGKEFEISEYMRYGKYIDNDIVKLI